ncbi:hypothetical protein CAC42_1201 [Sphaceloma murrayae]|uniref:EGF domain-specific O-linked N-acetylglucosamine transferase n=1 Tax=Sphaceloma murrayae TaxID=2082308 RepID=A0A2K1R2A3_9PEZI|nr:hypothetical protein CAC42_1201 [Sphaceloma murrayae]
MPLSRPSAKQRTKTYVIAAATLSILFLYVQIRSSHSASPSGPRLHSSQIKPIPDTPYAKTQKDEGLIHQESLRTSYGPPSPPDPVTVTTTVTATPVVTEVGNVLSADYGPGPRNDFCEDRFGVDFLSRYASNHTEFCSGGVSSLQCFYGQRGDYAPRPFDYFCVAEGVAVTDGQLQMSCEMSQEKQAEMETFPEYMYWTGVKKIMDNHFSFSNDASVRSKLQDLQCGSNDKRRSDKSTAVLFMRDTGANMWHSLMEVMVYFMSMDILSIARDENGDPYFVENEDTKDLQVIWTDEVAPGPYSDLWSLFSSKPSIHFDDMDSETSCFDRVIIPLPGHTNPLWEGDWHPLQCTNSTLLEAFIRRVFRHLHIDEPEEKTKEDKLVVTLLDRKKTRQLPDLERFVDILRTKYPSVDFQLLDLSATSFVESLAIYRNTDVLVGTHGAGLTGEMFMTQRKSVVEFIPYHFWHKGFRNLASLLGHRYYSLHGDRAPQNPEGEEGDWKRPPVRISEERFMRIMDVAIKAQSNIGVLNHDVDLD